MQQRLHSEFAVHMADKQLRTKSHVQAIRMVSSGLEQRMVKSSVTVQITCGRQMHVGAYMHCWGLQLSLHGLPHRLLHSSQA